MCGETIRVSLRVQSNRFWGICNVPKPHIGVNTFHPDKKSSALAEDVLCRIFQFIALFFNGDNRYVGTDGVELLPQERDIGLYVVV